MTTSCGSTPADGARPVDTGGPTSDQTVYDPNQRVFWLADANLAGNSAIRTQFGFADPGSNANGAMTYPAALRWVQALNAYDGGRGYLGHNNWQLPVTPRSDDTCEVAQGTDGNSFGPSCRNSALGSLYHVLLGHTFPDSAVPNFTNVVTPLQNLQPGLYWTSTAGSSGQATFSFNTGIAAENTTRYNFFHVLPMRPSAIGSAAPTGSGTILPYHSGSAAGKAVYDTHTGTTWLMDANLAASNNLGITGTTTILGAGGTTMTVPVINTSGAMLLSTASDWLDALNASNFGGAHDWRLPSRQDLETLFADLGLEAGDSRLTVQGSTSPFQNLQPFFYWACIRNQDGNSQSPCNGNDAGIGPGGVTPMDFCFNLDSGFQATAQNTKRFYVMVYCPAATLSQSAYGSGWLRGDSGSGDPQAGEQR